VAEYVQEQNIYGTSIETDKLVAKLSIVATREKKYQIPYFEDISGERPLKYALTEAGYQYATQTLGREVVLPDNSFYTEDENGLLEVANPQEAYSHQEAIALVLMAHGKNKALSHKEITKQAYHQLAYIITPSQVTSVLLKGSAPDTTTQKPLLQTTEQTWRLNFNGRLTNSRKELEDWIFGRIESPSESEDHTSRAISSGPPTPLS